MEQDIPAAGVGDKPCRWCGELHGVRCPWVKALEFSICEAITRVEFLTPADCVAAQAESEPQPDYPRKK